MNSSAWFRLSLAFDGSRGKLSIDKQSGESRQVELRFVKRILIYSSERLSFRATVA